MDWTRKIDPIFDLCDFDLGAPDLGLTRDTLFHDG